MEKKEGRQQGKENKGRQQGRAWEGPRGPWWDYQEHGERTQEGRARALPVHLGGRGSFSNPNSPEPPYLVHVRHNDSRRHSCLDVARDSRPRFRGYPPKIRAQVWGGLYRGAPRRDGKIVWDRLENPVWNKNLDTTHPKGLNRRYMLLITVQLP